MSSYFPDVASMQYSGDHFNFLHCDPLIFAFFLLWRQIVTLSNNLLVFSVHRRRSAKCENATNDNDKVIMMNTEPERDLDFYFIPFRRFIIGMRRVRPTMSVCVFLIFSLAIFGIFRVCETAGGREMAGSKETVRKRRFGHDQIENAANKLLVVDVVTAIRILTPAIRLVRLINYLIETTKLNCWYKFPYSFFLNFNLRIHFDGLLSHAGIQMYNGLLQGATLHAVAFGILLAAYVPSSARENVKNK